MTNEQEEANAIVVEDLQISFGIHDVEIEEGLDGIGPLVAVRWTGHLGSLDNSPLRLPADVPVDSPPLLTGVTIVDLDNGLLQRHINWLEFLGQLGYTVSSRRVGQGVPVGEPISP